MIDAHDDKELALVSPEETRDDLCPPSSATPTELSPSDIAESGALAA